MLSPMAQKGTQAMLTTPNKTLINSYLQTPLKGATTSYHNSSSRVTVSRYNELWLVSETSYGNSLG